MLVDALLMHCQGFKPNLFVNNSLAPDLINTSAIAKF